MCNFTQYCNQRTVSITKIVTQIIPYINYIKKLQLAYFTLPKFKIPHKNNCLNMTCLSASCNTSNPYLPLVIDNHLIYFNKHILYFYISEVHYYQYINSYTLKCVGVDLGSKMTQMLRKFKIFSSFHHQFYHQCLHC